MSSRHNMYVILSTSWSTNMISLLSVSETSSTSAHEHREQGFVSRIPPLQVSKCLKNVSVDSFRSIDVCLKDLALDCDERLIVRYAPQCYVVYVRSAVSRISSNSHLILLQWFLYCASCLGKAHNPMCVRVAMAGFFTRSVGSCRPCRGHLTTPTRSSRSVQST